MFFDFCGSFSIYGVSAGNEADSIMCNDPITAHFLRTTAGESDWRSRVVMFPAVSHLHTHSNHDQILEP